MQSSNVDDQHVNDAVASPRDSLPSDDELAKLVEDSEADSGGEFLFGSSGDDQTNVRSSLVSQEIWVYLGS